MAQQRSVDSLQQCIVRGLAAKPSVALARLWLLRPGESDAAPASDAEPTRYLDLVASAGDVAPIDDDDQLRRVPFGHGEVGTIAATGRPIEIPDLREGVHLGIDADWLEREGIHGFGGQPLVFLGESLGVLGVFTRIPFAPASLMWLRMIADQAAAAIVNARAFEEIERLKHRLELENEYLREEVLEAHAFGDLVGGSDALSRIGHQIELVAPTEANVLILGESGTGKELVAREIHRRSERADKPLVRVNCASVPRELYESEFFGHAQGAFTGAVRDRAGRFELANGGTLFLDEVGEIPLELQSKLLRVLQEGQYERVGEDRTRSTDVRILAATNRDLRDEVAAGRFREDLYYRLNVFPIEIAPLRERTVDIAPLAEHFLALGAKKLGRPAPPLSRANIEKLNRYSWPGNVRELQNVIERSLITSGDRRLTIELPEGGERSQTRSESVDEREAVVSDAEMKRRERQNILNALNASDWKVYGADGAASLLGIKPTTLASRIKKLGLVRERAG